MFLSFIKKKDSKPLTILQKNSTIQLQYRPKWSAQLFKVLYSPTPTFKSTKNFFSRTSNKKKEPNIPIYNEHRYILLNEDSPLNKDIDFRKATRNTITKYI